MGVRGESPVLPYKLNNKIYYYDSYAISASELSKYWANKGVVNSNMRVYLCEMVGFSKTKFGKKCINVI